MQESVIDYPKADGLCPDVWAQRVGLDGISLEWHLTDAASEKIHAVIQQVFPEAREVHITGSITSNSYAKNADIDLHFIGDVKNNLSDANDEQLNKELRAKYQQTYIGTHPIEIYFQSNEFQDYMSVGCYDVKRAKWLVGPEFKDPSFDPYSEYYADIQKNAEKLCQSIRNTILSMYEKAVALSKMHSESDVKKTTAVQLLSLIDSGSKLFDDIRRSRKVYSSPRSKEEALSYRVSRKWKIADATFKLLDKFGYMLIFKKIKELMSSFDISDRRLISDMLPASVISIIKDGIGNADKLAEKERVDEGPAANALLAVLLAVPGIVSAKTVQKEISTRPTATEVCKAVNEKTRMVGDYTAFQAANIIARTLYAEARGDGKDKGYIPVASVIYNRADGKMEDFAKVCLKKWQFSCWNGLSDDEKAPSKFQIKIPKSVKGNKTNEKLWMQAMEVAASMLAVGKGAFQPVTNANSYYATSMKKPPSWADELVKTQNIGGHRFGYLKNHVKFV